MDVTHLSYPFHLFLFSFLLNCLQSFLFGTRNDLFLVDKLGFRANESNRVMSRWVKIP